MKLRYTYSTNDFDINNRWTYTCRSMTCTYMCALDTYCRFVMIYDSLKSVFSLYKRQIEISFSPWPWGVHRLVGLGFWRVDPFRCVQGNPGNEKQQQQRPPTTATTTTTPIIIFTIFNTQFVFGRSFFWLYNSCWSFGSLWEVWNLRMGSATTKMLESQLSLAVQSFLFRR